MQKSERTAGKTMVEFMGKNLKNPLIASSCLVTERADIIMRLVRNGIEGVILKSCADYERGKYEGKRMFKWESGSGYFYAASPFEKEILTLDEAKSLLKELRPQTDILLIPSVTAATLETGPWIKSCKVFEELGADGIQLDFFYMGNLIGKTDGLGESIVRLLKALKGSLKIPVMPKLNINLPKDFIIPLLVEAGIEYVSLLDSVRSPYLAKNKNDYYVDENIDPLTTSCFGGWQLPLTLGYTYTAAQNHLKICAGGGITCEDDMKKLLAAGALTVQSATWLTKNNNRKFI